jgi:hypothetical protein
MSCQSFKLLFSKAVNVSDIQSPSHPILYSLWNSVTQWLINQPHTPVTIHSVIIVIMKHTGSVPPACLCWDTRSQVLCSVLTSVPFSLHLPEFWSHSTILILGYRRCCTVTSNKSRNGHVLINTHLILSIWVENELSGSLAYYFGQALRPFPRFIYQFYLILWNFMTF